MTDGLTGLAGLEASFARDLARLNIPPKPWIPEISGPDGQPMTDVVIVGGGMCGLAAAFALRSLGVSRIRHVDRGNHGQEGPWLTYARMETLRSPKHLTGPAQGLPSLTFRAWFEAQFGVNAWGKLDRIERPMWMEYLQWYRQVTSASIDNNVSLERIRLSSGSVELELQHSDNNSEADNRSETLHARQVVLATGREGQSRTRVPAPFKPFMGKQIQHASEAINFANLKDKHVAVIGLAASAFDNAATALESGAAKVTLIGRATQLPRLNKMKQTVYPGFTAGYPALPDKDKLRIMRHVAQSRIAPPRRSVQRVAANPRMQLLLGSTVTDVKPSGERYQIDTGKATLVVDHVILGTGFAIDLDTPPEISPFAGNILRWRDRVSDGIEDEWMNAPYLGDGFEFRSRAINDNRDEDELPGLDRIRCFTHTAQLSLGNLANDIPAVGDGAQRLANAVASSFFVEDRAHHWQSLEDYNDPELFGDEWPGVDLGE